MNMAEVGPGVAGGNNRQTLTDADAEGRALFQSWCEAAGMTMGVDAMGTMFATRPGRGPGGDSGLYRLASRYAAPPAGNMMACWACWPGSR